MKRAIIMLVCLMATACSPRYADFFPYHDNGTKKPSFTMLPVVNETNNPLVSDFPLELSKAVRNRLKRTGKTYSPPIAQMQKELEGTTVQELVRSKNLKNFSRFKGSDFVVLIETIDCNVVPYQRGAIKPLYVADIEQTAAKVLMLAVRLEIVNLKGVEPKIARMEVIKSNHMVSDNDLKDKKSLEMIRSRLAKDIAEKIEETVCVKK